MSEETKTEESTPETLGDYLRVKREKKGLSLKAISSRTKISLSMLENLENNQIDRLPNLTYVKGFVKSYSKVLGIKEDLPLELLKSAYSSPKKTGEIIKQKVDLEEKVGKGINPFVVIGGGLAVLIILVVAFTGSEKSEEVAKNEVKEEIEKKTKYQSLGANTPLKEELKSVNTKVSISTFSDIEKKEKTDVAVIENQEEKEDEIHQPEIMNPPEINKKSVEVEKKVVEVEKKVIDKQEKKEVKKVEEEVDESEKKIVKSEDKSDINLRKITYSLYSVKKETPPNEIEEFIPENYRNAVVKGLENVFIHAHAGDTWITYKKDDDPIKQFVLRKGRKLLIRGNDVRLTIGNTNTAVVFYNNHSLDFNPSKSGVKSFVFPQKDDQDYYLPLFIFDENGNAVTSNEYLAKRDSIKN